MRATAVVPGRPNSARVTTLADTNPGLPSVRTAAGARHPRRRRGQRPVYIWDYQPQIAPRIVGAERIADVDTRIVSLFIDHLSAMW